MEQEMQVQQQPVDELNEEETSEEVLDESGAPVSRKLRRRRRRDRVLLPQAP